ncbi:11590_t:CDS:2 [Funneliformis caledonium]|uniref:11590_t:CDS:1 n=1 Tax=Funneliformis caledonium TaxID=1117310 RepID=A0A9N9EP56_9GLOM|nr:11590_t:CDS:2 [Funneliformis caledonium]
MVDNVCYFLFLDIHYQYYQSRVIPINNGTWVDFVGLFEGLQKLFGLMNSMVDYDFIIVNKKVKFNSKKTFIEFIEINKNSPKSPVMILDIKEILDTLPTPSKLGEPSEWHFNNCNKAICLNHCPQIASSIVPVTLHCLIFCTFEDRCEEDPEREDNLFTYNFCREMAKFYDKEDVRRDIANSLLSKYLNIKVEPVMLGGN